MSALKRVLVFTMGNNPNACYFSEEKFVQEDTRMFLRGIEFGSVLAAAGAQGFFGEGYGFHDIWRYAGLTFKGVTFVSKTATCHSRRGNMPLNENYEPKDVFPEAIKAKFWKGVMLNAIGLSNPGFELLLQTGEWQARTEPFFISIMPVGDTKDKRRHEVQKIIEKLSLALEKKSFKAPVALQINLSCPNTGHDPKELIKESYKLLTAMSILRVPLMPKFSIASAPVDAVRELEYHPFCDAICISNTIPFGSSLVDWKRVWGSDVSPLKDMGGGGLSGKALKPLVCEWIARLRDAGFKKPINGGGGILSARDVNDFSTAGASSIFIGSVAVLRPWRMRSIICRANEIWNK